MQKSKKLKTEEQQKKKNNETEANSLQRSTK